jgi:hypothetical protein
VAGLLFGRFASTLFEKFPEFHHSVCFPLSGFDGFIYCIGRD